VTVVFVTQEYLLKVQSKGSDNCKFEFNYALQRQGVEKMVPVVMEEALANTKSEGWTGPVAMVLGNVLYVPMWEDGEQLQASIAQLAVEIRRRVQSDSEEPHPDPIPPIAGKANLRCASAAPFLLPSFRCWGLADTWSPAQPNQPRYAGVCVYCLSSLAARLCAVTSRRFDALLAQQGSGAGHG
jgi:hypothetical protein